MRAIDDYLPNNRPSEIKVYKRRSANQKVADGFTDGINIYLLRENLTNFTRAADVYVHEKTHLNTDGALDAGSDFRNYLTLALSKIALDQLKKVRPDLIKAES